MKKIIQANLLVLIALLAACSSTRFIYTLAGDYIQDEVAYFLNLDEEENVVLSQHVSEIVTWHRTSMLPSYAAYLTDMADKLAAGQYGDAHITKAMAKGRSLIEETVTGLTPRASKFLIRHQTVDAIEFMEKKIAMRRKERLEKMAKPEDIMYEDRLDRLTSNFERFLGTLTDAQVMLLEVHTRATLGESRIRLRNRTLRQKFFVEFLRTQPTEAALTAYLNKLLLSGHTITNADHQAFSEASLERFRELLVNILAISSTEQRETIISNLQTYAEDFKAVSG